MLEIDVMSWKNFYVKSQCKTYYSEIKTLKLHKYEMMKGKNMKNIHANTFSICPLFRHNRTPLQVLKTPTFNCEQSSAQNKTYFFFFFHIIDHILLQGV